jgi:carbohydrate diacid regulator
MSAPRNLDFITDVPRVVYLILRRTRVTLLLLNSFRECSRTSRRIIVLSMSETDIVLIKEIDHNTEVKEICRIAENVAEEINSELLVKTVIGVDRWQSTCVSWASATRKPRQRYEVGKVFDTEKSVIHYENLGIGRIIYQLPTTLCEMYLSEVFKKKNPIESLGSGNSLYINKVL